MDIADLADKETETYLAECRHQLKTVKPLVARGECYNCQEPVPVGKTFCDAYCKEDYEIRKNHRR